MHWEELTAHGPAVRHGPEPMGITDPLVLALATHAQLKGSGSMYPLYENTQFPARQGGYNLAGQVLVSGTSGKPEVNQELRPFDASASPSVTGQL